jgi:hypothetical protein
VPNLGSSSFGLVSKAVGGMKTDDSDCPSVADENWLGASVPTFLLREERLLIPSTADEAEEENEGMTNFAGCEDEGDGGDG